MKRIFLILLVLSMVLSFNVSTFANDEISVILNGNKIIFDVTPQIINNRTMVPLRAIFEALGATVSWNGETQTVTSTKNNTTISLTIESPSMIVNNQHISLDSPACIVDGRTLVPVRAISEAFGISVDWDNATRTVLINSFNGYKRLADFMKQSNTSKLLLYSFSCAIGSTHWSCDYLSEDNIRNVYSLLYDEPYNLRLILSADCVTSTYELRKKDADSGKRSVVLPPPRDNSSITYDSTTLPYDTNKGFDDSESVYACKLVKTVLSELEKNLPEIPVADLGFINYIDPNIKPQNYTDISSEINQINTYIAQSLYPEAIELCDNTLKKPNLSPAMQQQLSGLLYSAQTKYDDYLAKSLEKLLTDENKNRMYENCKSKILVKVNNPSTINFIKAGYTTEADGIHVSVNYETANSFGVYSNYYAFFVFNKDLYMTKQVIPPEKNVNLDVIITPK